MFNGKRKEKFFFFIYFATHIWGILCVDSFADTFQKKKKKENKTSKRSLCKSNVNVSEALRFSFFFVWMNSCCTGLMCVCTMKIQSIQSILGIVCFYKRRTNERKENIHASTSWINLKTIRRIPTSV